MLMIGELPLSVFVVVRMLKSVTVIVTSADILPVHQVATASITEPVRIKRTAVPITKESLLPSKKSKCPIVVDFII